jgi:hypothetical protein
MRIENKQQLLELLEAEKLNICHTRTTGVNTFKLINESFGEFTVNFAPYQDLDKIRSFANQFENFSYTVNH